MKTKSHGIQFHANNVRVELPTIQFQLNLHSIDRFYQITKYMRVDGGGWESTKKITTTTTATREREREPKRKN